MRELPLLMAYGRRLVACRFEDVLGQIDVRRDIGVFVANIDPGLQLRQIDGRTKTKMRCSRLQNARRFPVERDEIDLGLRKDDGSALLFRERLIPGDSF